MNTTFHTTLSHCTDCRDGSCIPCEGRGYIENPPAPPYGVSFIPCKACGGSCVCQTCSGQPFAEATDEAPPLPSDERTNLCPACDEPAALPGPILQVGERYFVQCNNECHGQSTLWMTPADEPLHDVSPLDFLGCDARMSLDMDFPALWHQTNR